MTRGQPIVGPRGPDPGGGAAGACRTRWWAAARAPAWWPGASRSRARSGPRSGTRTTGAARARLRRPGRPGGDRRPGPGRPRRQPHGPHVHRRPVRRLPLRLAAPHRLRQPADQHRTATTACGSTGAWITAPVRCAPPANKPTPAERDTCRPFLERELALLDARVFVPLGRLRLRRPLPHPRRGAPSEVRPRRRGAGRRRPLDRRQLPRQPAEHLHRQAHRAHARRRLHRARALAWP